MREKIFRPAWQRMNTRGFMQGFIWLASISLSAVMVLGFPDLYHRNDVGIFIGWAKIWAQGWENIYLAWGPCNYPILGMLSSAVILLSASTVLAVRKQFEQSGKFFNRKIALNFILHPYCLFGIDGI